MTLSVIIITKNEEQNIRRCLESVRFADEIIVLDSGSTDNTVVIAKEYTEHVYSTDWPGYGAQKQRALSKAQSDWVLNLDADESVSQELQQEMLEAMASDSADAFRVAIQMYFYNQPLKYSSSPKRHARLFKRANAHFSNDIVHEKIVLPAEARIGKIKNPIMHHSFKDVSHVLYKLNKYSSYSAKTYISKQRKPSFSKTLAGSIWMFFRCYVVQRGFLDGKRGFLFAVFNAQGTFYRGIKQIYRDKNLDQLPSLAQNGEELI
ncbi:lipopolysaccharide biosynthesis glycosyltransferase [Legionella gratiana]|uniref:Lipopolysaccharide biosynthesis glycosyltransferase n=1 Tax=Legionella gratiana TaxID=45066 RepID=A0A378JBR1_9GAMM|nr:glycosyltransferase family 2 protein [Legionella gratiana]KTD06503.1 lipopolysaccharide biosynthesis glycosyltransferase [Legionella gratiana]STX45324.1 lipopolysaccharide biosynthesis glycosyltransferase [Legionella gratiana]